MRWLSPPDSVPNCAKASDIQGRHRSGISAARGFPSKCAPLFVLLVGKLFFEIVKPLFGGANGLLHHLANMQPPSLTANASGFRRYPPQSRNR